MIFFYSRYSLKRVLKLPSGFPHNMTFFFSLFFKQVFFKLLQSTLNWLQMISLSAFSYMQQILELMGFFQHRICVLFPVQFTIKNHTQILNCVCLGEWRSVCSIDLEV